MKTLISHPDIASHSMAMGKKKTLLRIAIVYNIPLACDRSSADFLISSKLMDEPYDRYLVDYGNRLKSLKEEI